MIPLAYCMFSYWHTELVWVFVYAAGHIGQVTYLTVASWQQVELVTFISERCLIGLSFLVCVQVKFSPAGFPWILYLYFGAWRWNSICSISQVGYFLLLCVCHVLWLFCHVYELNTLFIGIRDSCPRLIYRVCLVSTTSLLTYMAISHVCSNYGLEAAFPLQSFDKNKLCSIV